MEYSDPNWESPTPRRFATVLLRPEGEKPLANDPDYQKDRHGFSDSAVLSYDVFGAVRRAVPSGWMSWPEFFGEAAMERLDGMQKHRKPWSPPTTLLVNRGSQLQRVHDVLRRDFDIAKVTNSEVRFSVPPGKEWAITLGNSSTASLNIQLYEQLLPTSLRGSIDEPPTKLVHLAGGYKSVGIPTPFPSADRPWTLLDEALQREQAKVALRMVHETITAWQEVG